MTDREATTSWFIVLPGIWEEGTITLRQLKDAISGLQLLRAESAEQVAEAFYNRALVIPVRVFSSAHHGSEA
jgi:hypothetical protein